MAPDRHWVIAKNNLTGEYKKLPFAFTDAFDPRENWLGFKYCMAEDVQKHWEEVGLFESREEAETEFIKLQQTDGL